MALAAEPSVIDDVIATSVTVTGTESTSELDILLEAESVSMSSSDLSSSTEMEVHVENIEIENETSLEEAPEESEQEPQVEEEEIINEAEGQSSTLADPPVETETGTGDSVITLDEVEVSVAAAATAAAPEAAVAVVDEVDAEIENISNLTPEASDVLMETESGETEAEAEVLLTNEEENNSEIENKVLENNEMENEGETNENENEIEAVEVETVESEEIVGVEGDENTNTSSCIIGGGDSDLSEVSMEAEIAEAEDDGKDNKENEDTEISEGQIILTATTSIEMDTESDAVQVSENVTSVTSNVAPPTPTPTTPTPPSETPPIKEADEEDDDIEILEPLEVDLTSKSPTKTSEIATETSTIVKSDDDSDMKLKASSDDDSTTQISTDAEVPLPSSSASSSPSHLTKLEDVENSINKIIAKSRSPCHGEEPSKGEVKAILGDQIRSMMRGDLETLIVDKIIEAICIHSNVGVLNQKLHQANAQKDRLFHKISNLQRQVTELSKAVRSVSENVGRNQKTVNKTNQPIRFYRSVGVQVFLEGPINPPPQSRSMLPEFTKPTMEPKKSVLKSGNNTPNTVVPQQLLSTLKPVPGQVPLSTVLNGNINPGLKRTMNKPTVSVAEVSRNVESQSKMRRVVGGFTPSASPGSTSTSPQQQQAQINNSIITNGMATNSKSPLRSALGMQPQQQHQMVMRNPAAALATKVLNLNQQATASAGASNAKNVEPGIVDLTDDDGVVTAATNATLNSRTPPKKAVMPATAAAASALIVNGKNNPSNVVLSQNGLQYRLISPGPQYQLVQNGQSYQIVTGGNQARPVFVSSASLPKGVQMRPVNAQSILRGLVPGAQVNGASLNINAGGQIMMRQMVPSAAAKQQQANSVTPMMMKQQQQFQQQGHGQPVNVSMVATRQQQQQHAQVSNKNMGNNVVGLRIPNQTVRPMGQAPRVNPRAVADAIKKFILPPLPPPAIVGNPRRCSKDIPPRPDLNLTEQEQGIVLSWTLKLGPNHAEIQTYQIYACQEPLFNSPKSGSWKRVGDVKALPLPMACTLSQFTDENRYHFIVRGVDVYNRTGPFCEAAAITLKKK